MNSHWTRMLMMTAVLAIATAQLLGIQQGYICDCGGLERWTAVDHCHGPHTADCHDHELEDHSCDGAGQDTHGHAEHFASLLAKPQYFHAIQILSPVSHVIPVDEWLRAALQRNASGTASVSNTDPRGSDPPPWAFRLAHAIALRV